MNDHDKRQKYGTETTQLTNAVLCLEDKPYSQLIKYVNTIDPKQKIKFAIFNALNETPRIFRKGNAHTH